jgi:DNA (cytosine-5)-methyltransferase 1
VTCARRPRLLDLFCGAGGAAMGYRRAGFDVVGVDHHPQPNYPFPFHQADALEFLAEHGHEYDCIAASPPCHAYSSATGRNRHNRRRYPDLVAPTREALQSTGLPYVIENVPGAPLLNAIQLCGSHFGLDIRRHRLFECSFPMMSSSCAHHWQKPRFRSLDSRQKHIATVVGVHGHLNYPGERELREKAMGIDWMTTQELTQAIPPAYTELIGEYLLAAVRAREAAA